METTSHIPYSQTSVITGPNKRGWLASHHFFLPARDFLPQVLSARWPSGYRRSPNGNSGVSG